MKKTNESRYNELEYLILAMVGSGVDSGYAMRKQMNSWRGARWSTESGSVYRVLRRLEKDGMVSEARRVGVPNRQRTEYELNPSGEEVLREWLIRVPPRSEFAHLVDPIRTRAYFLDRLEMDERVKVVKEWMKEAKILADDLRREGEEMATNTLSAAAFSNLIHLADARVDWLRKLLVALRVSEPTSE